MVLKLLRTVRAKIICMTKGLLKNSVIRCVIAKSSLVRAQGHEVTKCAFLVVLCVTGLCCGVRSVCQGCSRYRSGFKEDVWMARRVRDFKSRALGYRPKSSYYDGRWCFASSYVIRY